MEPTIQKLKRVETDTLDKAIRYYSILSSVNNIRLTEREIQLIAFIAVKGNMGYSSNRQEFIAKYKSSSATINNMISRLKKTGILIKDHTKIKVNPLVLPNFEQEITLLIRLVNG